MLDISSPMLTFLLMDSISHPNSQTLRQIGLELVGFLVYACEVTSPNQEIFSDFGQYSKDNVSSIQVLSSLIKLASNIQSEQLNEKQQKIALKISYRLLNMIKNETEIVKALNYMLKVD